MRKLSKKISMLMVLAMLVSLFSGIVSASAASAWSFKSSKYDVDVKETIVMDKNEYADFDLLKEDVEVTKATYTVKWESSDEDVVWVNAKTGQLRADKFGEAEAGDKAKISATFTNVATKKSATRYFYIEIADDAEYEIAADIADEAYIAGEKYALAAKVTSDGKEVEAKVEFTVDGVAATEFAPAKAGEYTIVATATIDGKEVASEKFVATVVEGGLVSAKQTAFNTVALTFGSADVAKAVAADASKVAAVWFAGSNEINAFVKSVKVDEKNAVVVNVELYNSIAKDTTYKFTVAEKSAEIKGVDLTKYAYISFATTSVPAGKDAEVKINFYNAEGILVDVKTTDFVLSPGAGANFQTNGSTINMYDPYGENTATITATYFMGYDENGNRIEDLTCTATITAYDENATQASNITKWAVGGDANYGGNSASIAVADGAKQLYFKFNVTDLDGNVTEHTNVTTTYFGGFEYASTNEAVLLVDTASGILYPVAAGSAQVVVKSIASWDNDVKNVIGVFNVNVVADRLLTSIAPKVNKTALSTSPDDVVWIKPVAKDQFGAGFTPVYNVELVTAVDGVTVEIKTKNAVVENGVEVEAEEWEVLTVHADGPGLEVATSGADSSDGNAPFFEIRAIAAPSNKYAKNIQVAVTATQGWPYKQLTRTVNVSVKQPNQITRYSIDGLTTNFDIDIAGRPDYATGNWFFYSEIKLNAYDQYGYLVEKVEFGKGKDNAINGYYMTIKKGTEDLTNKYEQDGALCVDPVDKNYTGEWRFNAVTCTPGDLHGAGMGDLTKIVKGAGTYTITIYKVDAKKAQDPQIAQKNIVVTDTTAAIATIQKDNKIAKSEIGTATGAALKAIVIEELKKDLEFKRDGKTIDVEIVDADIVDTADGKRIYITNVSIREKFYGFQISWAPGEQGAAHVAKLWGVGKVFEVDFTK